MLHVADGVTGCVRLVWFAHGLDSKLNKQACMVLVTWSAAAASHTLAKCEMLPGWKTQWQSGGRKGKGTRPLLCLVITVAVVL